MVLAQAQAAILALLAMLAMHLAAATVQVDMAIRLHLHPSQRVHKGKVSTKRFLFVVYQVY